MCEYAGEILKPDTAKQRFQYQDANNIDNYIHVLNEHCSNGKVISTYIDPRLCGNVGRFINHSCEPNLFMVPVRIDHVVPRLALFALRDIAADEELSYNYSGDLSSSKPNSADEQTNAKKCFCGSKKCAGVLPVDQSLISK